MCKVHINTCWNCLSLLNEWLLWFRVWIDSSQDFLFGSFVDLPRRFDDIFHCIVVRVTPTVARYRQMVQRQVRFVQVNVRVLVREYGLIVQFPLSEHGRQYIPQTRLFGEVVVDQVDKIVRFGDARQQVARRRPFGVQLAPLLPPQSEGFIFPNPEGDRVHHGWLQYFTTRENTPRYGYWPVLVRVAVVVFTLIKQSIIFTCILIDRF